MMKSIALPLSGFAALLTAVVAIGGATPAQAGTTNVDSNTTLNSDVRGTDFYVGLHANGVVLTITNGAILNGDQFTGGIRGFGNSRIEINGGTIAGVETLTSSVAHVTGGTVTTISDYTNALIDGGTITNLNLLNISNSNYNSVGRATMTGGAVSIITNGDLGTISVSGGALTGYLKNSNFSIFALSGGTITGTIYSLDQYNTTNIYGSGLALLNPVAGKSKDFNGYTGTYYDLIGTLSDGTPINTKYFSANSFGTTRINLINSASGAPEPGTLVLLLAPLSVTIGRIVRRRRRF